MIKLLTNILNWLGNAIAWLVSRIPIIGPLSANGHPVITFGVTYAVGRCAPADVLLSFSIAPAGARIRDIRIFRVYDPDGPLPDGAPADRLPGGEYFELVFPSPRETVPVPPLVQTGLYDRGLPAGRHWGHTAYYREYRMLVTTVTVDWMGRTRDDITVDSRFPFTADHPNPGSVSFGRNPSWEHVDSMRVLLHNVRTGPAFVSNTGTIRFRLDNVSGITATNSRGDVLRTDSIVYAEDTPTPRMMSEGERSIIATVTLSGDFRAAAGEMISLTFHPLDDPTHPLDDPTHPCPGGEEPPPRYYDTVYCPDGEHFDSKTNRCVRDA